MRRRKEWIFNLKYGIMEFGKKRLGNWVVTKYNKDGVPHIKVSPVNGEYSWEYSSMDEMYLMMESALDDESVSHGLQTCIGMMSAFIHAADPVFYDLYLKCMECYAEIAEVRKPTTSEEEQEIVREMKVEYELSEELKKENVVANSVDDVQEKVGATLDKSDLSIPTNGNVEATEAWSVENGEEFEFKAE